eukprot:358787-Prymnesium_polylepis.3
MESVPNMADYPNLESVPNMTGVPSMARPGRAPNRQEAVVARLLDGIDDARKVEAHPHCLLLVRVDIVVVELFIRQALEYALNAAANAIQTKEV